MNIEFSERLAAARQILSTLEACGLDARLKVAIRPAEKLTPQLQEQIREYADELRQLLTDEGGNVAGRLSGVPCIHCRGTGRQPTALELLDAPGGLGWTLRALMWSDERINLLRDELRPDEVVVAARWGGLDLRSPDGGTRTLLRQHG